MNMTHKRILGWGLVVIGVLMVAGVVVSNEYQMLKSPILYLGLIVIVVGVVVLKGDGMLSDSLHTRLAARQVLLIPAI